MRIAAIRFINALPLIYGLEKNPAHSILFETPSNCYKRLLNREVDLALIPIFGTQTSDQIYGYPELGIAAERRTESVLLFSKKPPSEIRSVALDPASLTSTTLLKIILQKKYQAVPDYVTNTEADVGAALHHHDAVLTIGDAALLEQKGKNLTLDLAEEWYSFTGLPFLFAVWASHRKLDETEKNELLDSYEQATQNWDEIYARAGQALRLDIEFLKRYYNYDLHYRLTKLDLEGFQKYIEFASEMGIIKSPRVNIWM
jgi:chorismate dehydratase